MWDFRLAAFLKVVLQVGQIGGWQVSEWACISSAVVKEGGSVSLHSKQ